MKIKHLSRGPAVEFRIEIATVTNNIHINNHISKYFRKITTQKNVSVFMNILHGQYGHKLVDRSLHIVHG